MNKLAILFATIAASFLGCVSEKKTEKSAELVLLNGQFFTGDSSNLHASALAIFDGKIIFVGDEKGVQKFISPKTVVENLDGAFAMPGFIEGHGHFSSLGESLMNLNLSATKSWQEIALMVAEKAKTTPKNDWIQGRGWHQEKWTTSPGATTNGYPSNDLLNKISPENPVVLFHASGHGLIANDRAMQLAGITRETPDPVGGRIVRDASGHAIGVFEENAMDIIGRPFNEFLKKKPVALRRAEWEKAIQLAENQCLMNGVTSFQDAGAGFEELGWYEDLAAKKQLNVRLWSMISAPDEANTSRLGEYPKIGLGGGFLTIRAVKCYFDGALGSFGAWLLEDYSDKPGSTGQNTTPTSEIARMAEACAERGLQCCVHAIGDRANREVLNIFEKHTPGKDLRWRVEHAQHIDNQDIKRFRPLGVIASMQALHCTSDAPFVEKRLGLLRSKTGAYAWRSLLDAGAHLANGTDTPVENVAPLPCIYAACTRHRTDAPVMDFFPEQKMTRAEALASYTRWNTWAAFQEGEKGTLSVGKMADVVVLSRNLETCSDDEILKTEVLKTIVGGKTKFKK